MNPILLKERNVESVSPLDGYEINFDIFNGRLHEGDDFI